MAIKSRPFGGVTLTGEDAAAFLRQVERGPSEEQRLTIAAALERGSELARERKLRLVVKFSTDPDA